MVTAAPPTKEVNLTLPPLHRGRDGGGQVEIVSHSARFKVVVCGRRWGKTTLGVWVCLETSLHGGLTWWVAPTYPIAMIGWRMLKRIVKQIPGATIREGDREAHLPGGGVVAIKSADNPDSLRGEGLDGVVLDEVGQIKQEAWTEALRPALADKRGWALFIGTPKGRNWLWNLFRRAQVAPNWHAWRKPTSDNPYISLEELEDARQDAPMLAIYKQEYEADFGASQLEVYPEFSRDVHRWKYDELPKFDLFYGGLDFGGTTIGSHKSTGLIGGYHSASDTLIELKEFESSGYDITDRQVMWMAESEAQLRLLQRKAKQPMLPILWAADRTQSAFIQIAKGAGFKIRPSKGGKDSITGGIALVQRRMTTHLGRPHLYYADDLTFLPSGIERYRYPEYKEGEEKVQSQNPLKVNDDMVDAFRYQVERLDSQPGGDPQKLYSNVLARVA